MNDKGLGIDSSNDIHYEANKFLVPYLLLCDGITFEGTESRGGTVYFLFSPASKVLEAINKYYQRGAEPIQPKDLIDAIEHYRDLVHRVGRPE